MQAYSCKARAKDPHALPDLEVFFLSGRTIVADDIRDDDGEPASPGWYWQACLPGCMPDSEMNGPFASEAEALADAQDCDCDECTREATDAPQR